MCTTEDLKPKYRFQLRAKIAEAGFRTISEYSGAVGVNIARISRIISGWEIPGVDLSKRMSQELGMSLDEFAGLLN